MNRREAGRLGGLRTFELYGSEHMRRIGKLGFAAMAKRFGGSRRVALGRLVRQGAVAARDYTAEDLEAVYQENGLGEYL